MKRNSSTGIAVLAGIVLAATACSARAPRAAPVPPVQLEQGGSYVDPRIPVVPQLIDEAAGFVRGLPAKRTAAADEGRGDSFAGTDKAKHFFISAFIESVAFGGLELAGARRNTALAGAIAVTAVAALSRETYDRRTKGLFSFGDLLWDSLGAGAALLVLTRTER